MTQARAAAPVSSDAAEAVSAADGRGSNGHHLEGCQQNGGCGRADDSAASAGQLSPRNAADSHASRSATLHSENSTDDDWLQKFLKEYEKASRFSVTNFSHETEGFDFGAESEGEAEEASGCGISVNLEDTGDENNRLQTQHSNDDVDEKVTESTKSLQVSVSPEKSNFVLLETSASTPLEELKLGIVSEQSGCEESAKQKRESDIVSDLGAADESCQLVSEVLHKSEQQPSTQRQCQNSPFEVASDLCDNENSNSLCLPAKLQHSLLSPVQSCIERNDIPDNLKQCTNELDNNCIRDKLVQEPLICDNSTECISTSANLPDCSRVPLQVKCNDDRTNINLCEKSYSDTHTKNDVFVNHEIVDCQSDCTTEISVHNSKCESLTDDVICEPTLQLLASQEIKTKVDTEQEKIILQSLNLEDKTGVTVSEDEACEQPISSRFSNFDEQNSSEMLCQKTQFKCTAPFINSQFQDNDKTNNSVQRRDSGGNIAEKECLSGVQSNDNPNTSSEVTKSLENMASQPCARLLCQNGTKVESRHVKSIHDENISVEHGDNMTKINDENTELMVGSNKNMANMVPETTAHNDVTNIVHKMEAPLRGNSDSSRDPVCGMRETADEFHQKSELYKSHDNLQSLCKDDSAQACPDSILRSDNIPTLGCTVVKRKSDLLREQFFANNMYQPSVQSDMNTREVLNHSAFDSTGNKTESLPETSTTNEHCQNSRVVGDIGASQIGFVKNGFGTDAVHDDGPCTRRAKTNWNSTKHDSQRHSDDASGKNSARTLAEKPKKSQHPSSKDKSSKRSQPSLRAHKEALLARVTHQQASLKHSPPPLVLLNGAAVDLAEKSVHPNGPGNTRLNSQLFREVHELFSEFATPTPDAKSESICSAGNRQVEMDCHSSLHLKQHRMFGQEQKGSQSSSESATPTNDDPWVLSFSDKDVLQASCKVNCKICRKPFNDPRILPCLHTFCAYCLDQCESYVSTTPSVECNGETSELLPKGKSKSRTLSPSPDKNVCHQNHRSPSSSPSKFHCSTIHHIATSASSESSNLSTSSSSSISSNFEQKRTILCPLCDAEVDLPAQGAHFLPVNFIAKKQLQDAREERLMDRLGCDLCCSDSDASSMHCKNCGINMCSFCSEAHKRQRKTSNHLIITLQEAKSQGSINKSSMISCPLHPLEELKLFCKTCVQTVCRDCVIIGHRDHDCLFISEVSDQQTAVLQAVLTELKPQTADLKYLVDNLHTSSKQVDVQAEHAWEQVNTFIDSYIQALQLHRKSLLSQIRKIKCQKHESLTLHRIQLEQALEDLESSVSFAGQILQLESEVEFLTLLGPVLQRLRELGKISFNPEIQNDESICFNPFDKAGVVQGFPVLGTVSEKQAIPSQCIVKGDGLLTARQGQRSDVFLITRYPDGSLKKKGGENVQAEMVSRDTPSKSIPVDVVDCHDGSYLITFCSDLTGLFLLHVTLDGKPVQGSPFVIPVKPKLRQHSGVFHCCSFCSSGGSKEARCACSGTMPGGYKGCGHGHSSHPGSKHWSCCGKTVEKSDCSRPTSATYQFTL